MEIKTLQINGNLQNRAFTSLQALCKCYGLNYNTVTKMKPKGGKLTWINRDGDCLIIRSVHVCKIEGRGRDLGRVPFKEYPSDFSF